MGPGLLVVPLVVGCDGGGPMYGGWVGDRLCPRKMVQALPMCFHHFRSLLISSLLVSQCPWLLRLFLRAALCCL